VLKNEHVAVTILYDVFPPVVKKWVSVLNYIVMLVVDVLFIKYGWAYAVKMGKQLSMGMEIPMFYMYGLMPLCVVICALCVIIKCALAAAAPVSAFENADQ
jgi:TRAP-type C4-dicarboxylate transport system permease small subunit